MLRSVLDQSLETIQVDMAVNAGSIQDEPIGLLLRFTGGVEIGVTLGEDGESIRVARRPLPALPEGETEITLHTEDQTQADQWMPFVGRKVEDVLEVRDAAFGGKGSWIGIEFQFEGGAVLSAYNWGDELLCTAPPEETGTLDRRSLRRREDEGDGRESFSGEEGDEGDEGMEGAEAGEAGEAGPEPPRLDA